LVSPRRIAAYSAIFLLGVFFAAAPLRAEGLPLIEFPEKPQAPALKLPLLNGGTFDIGSYRGRIIVVNFWASWCAPCLREMPVFEKAWQSLQQEDILLVAVNLGDTPEKIRRFLKHRPVTFPVLVDIDSDSFAPWQIHSLPTTYIVGPDGFIHFGAIGDREWDSTNILDTIRNLR
jgi:thiol-disulfide isomerase/thioredoxin